MNWEFSVLDYISSFHNNILDYIMIFISSLNNSGFIWIVITIIFLCSKKYRKIGITCAIALIIMQISGNMIIKNLVDRPRPYEIRNISILISAPQGSSFPSGHTYSSFAAATAIFLWHKKWGIGAYILAFLIGLSRMYLYVHFPTDVIGAAILGIIDGIICYYIVKRYIFPKLMKSLDKVI